MKKKWAMPYWMRPYAKMVTNTGASPSEDPVLVVETMYNETADPRVNLPLSTLQACVKSQVGMLYRLHEAELLPASHAARLVNRVNRQREALETIAGSLKMALGARALPDRLRPGFAAVIEQAQEALK